LPDPCDPRTFASAKLDWAAREQPEHAAWLAFYRQLLALRHREITPRLAGVAGNAGSFEIIGEQGLCVAWRLGDGSRLSLVANLGDEALSPAEEGEPPALDLSSRRSGARPRTSAEPQEENRGQEPLLRE